jgi:hypothetical protein
MLPGGLCTYEVARIGPGPRPQIEPGPFFQVATRLFKTD